MRGPRWFGDHQPAAPLVTPVPVDVARAKLVGVPLKDVLDRVREAVPTQRATDLILMDARTAGVVHEDVTIDEAYVLIRGLAQATATMPPSRATLTRAIDIIWRGITPSRRRPSPLPIYSPRGGLYQAPGCAA
jgi:hypothetical protein